MDISRRSRTADDNHGLSTAVHVWWQSRTAADDLLCSSVPMTSDTLCVLHSLHLYFDSSHIESNYVLVDLVSVLHYSYKFISLWYRCPSHLLCSLCACLLACFCRFACSGRRTCAVPGHYVECRTMRTYVPLLNLVWCFVFWVVINMFGICFCWKLIKDPPRPFYIT
jgi:hypothetical protein